MGGACLGGVFPFGLFMGDHIPGKRDVAILSERPISEVILEMTRDLKFICVQSAAARHQPASTGVIRDFQFEDLLRIQ